MRIIYENLVTSKSGWYGPKSRNRDLKSWDGNWSINLNPINSTT